MDTTAPPAISHLANGRGKPMLQRGQTDRVLALAVILALAIVAGIAAVGGIWLELGGRPAPSWLAMLAGSGVGALASLLARPDGSARSTGTKAPRSG